jgi:hypothetical protein
MDQIGSVVPPRAVRWIPAAVSECTTLENQQKSDGGWLA